jgi:hypothetical protein
LPLAEAAASTIMNVTTQEEQEAVFANAAAHSHHWMSVNGRLIRHSAPYRYVWPSELDLMAKLAGLRLRHRWANWHEAAFQPDSPGHVSVYDRPRGRAFDIPRFSR